MTNDEHRITDVVSELAPDRASPEYIEDILMEFRQFVNEYDSNPSQRNFHDWSENHSDGVYRKYFGSWNNAVAAVGGEPNEPNGYDWDEVEQKLKRLIEEEITIGDHVVAGPNEIPTMSYIDKVEDIPTNQTLCNEYGPRENWKYMLGLNGAHEVDVDLTDFEW